MFFRSVLGPEGQRRRAGGRKQKQENRGLEGGPGPQGSSGLVPRWGEGGGRDGSVGRPDGRRAPSVGLTNGAVGAVGVGCTVAWAAKMHALSLVLRGFGYEIAPAARCLCFLNRGPGPSDGAGGGALTKRSKTLRPGRARAQVAWIRPPPSRPPPPRPPPPHSLIELVLAKMEDENILMYRNQVIEFI